MAASVVRSKQTLGGSESGLVITSALKGNTLAAFVMQSGSVVAPTLAGWSFSPTSALQGASANSLWFGTKIAAGGETSISPAPGTGGTVIGVCYFEVEGAGQEVDAIVASSNGGSVTTQVSGALTTTAAGDVILGCVGFASGNGGSSAWTGTGPMTSVGGETRAMGGYYVPGTTLAAATFTANWVNSRTHGMLVVALKPSSSAAVIALAPGSSVSSASARVQAPSAVALGVGASTSSATAAITAPSTIALAAGTATSSAASALRAPTAIVLGAGSSVSTAQGSVVVVARAVAIALAPGVSQSSAVAALRANARITLAPGITTSSASAVVSYIRAGAGAGTANAAGGASFPNVYAEGRLT